MAELTKDLEQTLKAAGLKGDACWKHKQSGKWIVYHWACERLATHAGIKFSVPVVLNSDPDNIAILVTGFVNDNEEWSIGEASKTNNKNPYPWAMAEKRAKDRVILKLLNLHGIAYSEEEADDFKRPPDLSVHESPASQKPIKTEKKDGPKITELKQKARDADGELRSATDESELDGIVAGYATMAHDLEKFLPDWHAAYLAAVKAKRESFKPNTGAG